MQRTYIFCVLNTVKNLVMLMKKRDLCELKKYIMGLIPRVNLFTYIFKMKNPTIRLYTRSFVTSFLTNVFRNNNIYQLALVSIFWRSAFIPV